jgi:transcriptional regulator with XRE-family HTH domain
VNKSHLSEEELIIALRGRIKSLRINNGMTQQQLSDILGIEESALRRIESGRTNPTTKTLYRISNAFKLTLSELLNGL